MADNDAAQTLPCDEDRDWWKPWKSNASGTLTSSDIECMYRQGLRVTYSSFLLTWIRNLYIEFREAFFSPSRGAVRGYGVVLVILWIITFLIAMYYVIMLLLTTYLIVIPRIVFVYAVKQPLRSLFKHVPFAFMGVLFPIYLYYVLFLALSAVGIMKLFAVRCLLFCFNIPYRVQQRLFGGTRNRQYELFEFTAWETKVQTCLQNYVQWCHHWVRRVDMLLIVSMLSLGVGVPVFFIYAFYWYQDWWGDVFPHFKKLFPLASAVAAVSILWNIVVAASVVKHIFFQPGQPPTDPKPIDFLYTGWSVRVTLALIVAMVVLLLVVMIWNSAVSTFQDNVPNMRDIGMSFQVLSLIVAELSYVAAARQLIASKRNV